MLILTRRVGESIIIGDDVVMTVLGIKGNQVRIGINAPSDVTVHREEIYQRIQQEKAGGAAASTSPAPAQEKPAAPSTAPVVQVKKKRETKAEKDGNK